MILEIYGSSGKRFFKKNIFDDGIENSGTSAVLLVVTLAKKHYETMHVYISNKA